ncbi:MAG TPA: cell division protein FtsL [Terriglobales bacterium]|nr:cell division protein FtsL [Terriglobales bacterium]
MAAAEIVYPAAAQAGEWRDPVIVPPRGMFLGTPEIYFAKRIDNSRVAKITDPQRRREMVLLGITLAVLLLFAMVYAWQHFSAVEYGYKIEQLKAERDTIAESNRALSLEEASLKDPGRIDRLARELGMQRPVDGQWQPMDNTAGDPSTPVMAKANGIMVVSAMQ